MNLDKFKHNGRRQQKQNHINRQISILKIYKRSFKGTHYFHKRSSTTCGNPYCSNCGNP